MVAALVVFVVVTSLVFGAFHWLQQLPDWLAARRLDRRLREVSRPAGADLPATPSFVTEVKKGPLPAIDKALGGANSSLATLIEQSGVHTTPSAIMLAMIVAALVSGFVCMLFIKVPIFWLIAALIGSFLPYAWLRHKRTKRMKRFEEQFPEALDLLSRAVRAGHAFQTAMGMVADELPPPVGIEFKKAFEQQNFGLPLGEVLNQMAERVPLLDVKFFVTAVMIQRDTGGNLAEILDNIAAVIRDRFRVKRQIRVISAHGRLTGGVLIAIPPSLGAVLFFINPNHWATLTGSLLGLQLVGLAVVLQITGTLIIRKLIRIEY